MEEFELIKYLGSVGGFAGVAIGLIFLAYKLLVGQMREDRKFMEDRLSGILDHYNQVVDANTKALTELITLLRARNGR